MMIAFPCAPDSSVSRWEGERCLAERSIVSQSRYLLPPPAQQRVVVSLLFQHRDALGGWQGGRASL